MVLTGMKNEVKMSKRLKTIKKDHRIIDGVLPLLEEIKQLPGVKRIIPGRISRSGKINTKQPTAYIKVQRPTSSGLKLLAHTHEAIQEIFLVVPMEKKEYIIDKLKEK